MNDTPLKLTFLNYTHVEEFPRECLQWIVDTLKEHGIDGLKANKFQTASCVFCLLAWAAGKLTKPDDGVLIGDYSADLGFINECNTTLIEHTQATESIGSGPVVDVMVKLLIRYLMEVLGDPDKMEEIIEKVLAWFANRS